MHLLSFASLLSSNLVFSSYGTSMIIVCLHIEHPPQIDVVQLCETQKVRLFHPCNGGSDGSVWLIWKWSMQWVSG